MCGQPKFCHEMHRSFFKVTRERENAVLRFFFGPSYQTSEIWEGTHHFELELGKKFNAEDFVETVLEEALKQSEQLGIQALRNLPSRYMSLLRKKVRVEFRRPKYLNSRRCFVCCDEFDVASLTFGSGLVSLSSQSEMTQIYVCNQCVPEVRSLASCQTESTVTEDLELGPEEWELGSFQVPSSGSSGGNGGSS